MKDFTSRPLLAASAAMAVLACGACFGAASVKTGIFPEPREAINSGADFVIDKHVILAVPAQPSEQDLFLAGSMAQELGDRFGVHLKTERLATLDPSRRAILIGTVTNPLVAAWRASHALKISAQDPGPEGYVLQVSAATVLVAGSDSRGAFYGMQSLRQLAGREGGQLRIKGVNLRDWPDKPFRGLKLYLPGRANIPYFKRFVRDFMALYKYNTLIMQMNASMRLDRHPELNTGWIKFAQDTNYSRRNYPPGVPHEMDQNSTHHDLADGDILEKEEVADLARWVRRHHIELIPELPSFTHSYYLLSEHKDLAEVPVVKWPDTFCPSNPKSYELLFEVFDEYIRVLKPRMIHIGHDELFIPVDLCPLCKNKDIGERYGEDVRKTRDYLAGRGIQLALWGDMLLQGVRGVGLQNKKAPDGWAYRAPGGLTPEQVQRLIPKDILIFNWFWGGGSASDQHEARLDEMGFRQIYGNFGPHIERYDVRKKRATLLGGAPSAWFATSEAGFGKDMLPDFLGCSNILWRGDVIGGKELSGVIQSLLPVLRTRLRGEVPPSGTEPENAPVDIAASFNSGSVEPSLGVDLTGLKTGTAALGNVRFDVADRGVLVGTDGVEKTGLPREAVIKIGQDATSLLFLQASARPATNKEMFRLMWDMDDTADLLGWYEVVYEDGFVTTIPIRYGVNIQEWNWAARKSAGDYCYGADAVPMGNGVTFFAFEWKNPRLGKVITEIRLKGTTGFHTAPADFVNEYGPVIPKNAVILKAVSVVKKRS